MDRRTWLKLASSAAVAAAFPFPAFPEEPSSTPVPFSPVPFSEEQLDALARELANKPYVAPEKHLDSTLSNITYEEYQNIHFKPENVIWREDSLAFRLEMLAAAGSFYAFPVEVFSVEAGRATPIVYSPDLFSFLAPLKPPAQNSRSGFAGFRVRSPINEPTVFDEVLTFLGGSYLRAIATGQVPGVSARGLAINTGQVSGEEFPLFRSFWIERPKPGEQHLVIHALLDSNSTTGRYKFTLTPGHDTVMDVQAVIYPRKLIPYVGIAPIASKFFSGAYSAPKRRDYRPNIHDSGALYMLNGSGEWIWRPLINPERLQFSVFADKSPKGFGLMQRDRSFSDYQDLKQQYEKRPSLWIEPVGDWGEGSIDLIELPALDETNENIVCFWRPKDGLGPGISHHFNYRMHWCWEPPIKSNRLSVTQTRLGETHSGDALFIVDFSSTDSCEPCNSGPLMPAVSASAGVVRNIELIPSSRIGGHRLRFEFAPSGSEPVDLRASLSSGGKPISDSWIFRWTR